MTDFADDIRKIAKGTRRKGALSPYSGREPVLGGSVTLVTDINQGVGPTPTGTAPNSPTSQENSDGDNPAASENNPDASYSGGAGGTDSAVQQGGYDVEDVMDGADGPQTSSDQYGDSTSEYDNSLKDLTGATDCDTGDCINFHMDGNFPTPEGWDDPDTPPPDDSNQWEIGYQYSIGPSAPVAPFYASPNEAAALAAIERSNANVNYVNGTGLVTSIGVVSFPEGLPAGAHQISMTAVSVATGQRVDASTTIYRSSCTPSSDPLDQCALTNPDNATAWPEDGCYDLALQGGNFVTSPYDSEAPANAGGSKKSFCFGTGRTGTVEATANGGFMIYETESGAPTGTTRVYDANGRMTAAGDSTDQFQDQWRPK